MFHFDFFFFRCCSFAFPMSCSCINARRCLYVVFSPFWSLFCHPLAWYARTHTYTRTANRDFLSALPIAWIKGNLVFGEQFTFKYMFNVYIWLVFFCFAAYSSMYASSRSRNRTNTWLHSPPVYGLEKFINKNFIFSSIKKLLFFSFTSLAIERCVCVCV